MSIVDLLIALAVLVGLWRGFQHGAIKTAMSLVAWLLALIVATHSASGLAPLLIYVIDGIVLQTALAFLLVFLAVISVLQLFTFLLIKLLKHLKLSFLDRLAGGVLGAGVGILKVLVVLSIIAPVLVRMPVWDNSPLAQSLLPFAPLAKTLLLEMTGELWEELNNTI